MPKAKKKIEERVDISKTEPQVEVIITEAKTVNPLTQEFGNGDLNILRDKINEIIKSI